MSVNAPPFDPPTIASGRYASHFFLSHEPVAWDGHRHVYNLRTLRCESPEAKRECKAVGTLPIHQTWRIHRAIAEMHRRAYDNNIALDYPAVIEEDEWSPE